MRPDNQDTVARTDLKRVLLIVRTRWLLAALCTIGVTVAVLVFTELQPKKYTATSQLLLRDNGIENSLLATPVSQPTVDPTRQADTNIQLVQSPEVAALTAKATGIPLSTVTSDIQASAQGQTDVVDVQATDHDPVIASRIANGYAQQAIVYQRNINRQQVVQVQTAIAAQLAHMSKAERASTEGQLLESRNQELQLIASTDTGNAVVIQHAGIPSSPSSPNVKRNAILGLLFGLLLGIGASALAERLSGRVRESEELGDLHGLPVLADVPESAALDDGGEQLALDEGEYEAFRMLVGRLRYTPGRPKLESILVTSAGAQEGKSTVAWHLAVAAALGGQQRVVLVEADLHGPVLARRHQLVSSPGLVDVLSGSLEVNDVLQTVILQNGSNGHATTTSMDVIVAGRVPEAPGGLLEGASFDALLERLNKRYDLIVLDSVPSLLVADAMPLVGKVGGVVVVSRVGVTTREQAALLREQLEALGAPTIGLIANRVKPGFGRKYGYYINGRQAPKALPEPRKPIKRM